MLNSILKCLNIKLHSKVLGDVFFYLMASIVPALLLVLINPFLAKNLSPHDYAIIGYISSFATIITPIVTFMLMRYYFVNYFKSDEEQRQRIQSAILHSLILFSGILSVLVIACISVYHFCFNSNSSVPLFPYLVLSVSAIWLGAIFTFMLSEFRIQRHSRNYFVFSTINGIIKVVFLLIGVVLFKAGAIGYEMALAFTSFAFFIYCVYRYRKAIFVKIDLTLIKQAFVFCWPIALGGCLEFFSNGMGRVLLERLDNNVEFGYYTVGNQFATYISLFTTALFTTFNPDIYECATSNNRKKLFRIFCVLVLVQLLVVSIFILLSPYLIDLLTAGRYNDCVNYAQILAVSQVFTIIFYFVNDVTIAYGYPKIVMFTKLIAGLLSIFILNLLISNFEYFGAAIGQSVIYVIYTMVNILLIIYIYRVNKNAKYDGK